MAKLKLTKSELRRQKDGLVRFNRYLPMLKLKKQQLQVEIGKVHQQIKKLMDKTESFKNSVYEWVGVFAEGVPVNNFFKVKKIKKDYGNIAGIDIPVFEGVEFEDKPYDLFLTPVWVDRAIETCKDFIRLKGELLVLEEQEKILQEELRIIVQRVNLFEKVKIPETRENIRVIQIYLGDLQTAEVVRGKIAKAKLSKVDPLRS